MKKNKPKRFDQKSATPSGHSAYERKYRCIRHFTAIKHWGGEEALAKTHERDKRKKKLCQDYGVKLICLNYDDPIEENLILEMIKSVNK